MEFTDAPEMAENAIGDYIGQDNDVEDENTMGRMYQVLLEQLEIME